jgi:hypothetical protein
MGAVFFEGFFPRSLTGTITHILVGNLVTIWLQFVVMIMIWKFYKKNLATTMNTM